MDVFEQGVPGQSALHGRRHVLSHYLNIPLGRLLEEQLIVGVSVGFRRSPIPYSSPRIPARPLVGATYVFGQHQQLSSQLHEAAHDQGTFPNCAD
jgi:hypothetical protein